MSRKRLASEARNNHLDIGLYRPAGSMSVINVVVFVTNARTVRAMAFKLTFTLMGRCNTLSNGRCSVDFRAVSLRKIPGERERDSARVDDGSQW